VGVGKGEEVAVPGVWTELRWRLHVRAERCEALKEGNVGSCFALRCVTPKLRAPKHPSQFSKKLGGYEEFEGAIDPGADKRPSGALAGDEGGDEHARVENYSPHLSSSTPV